MRDEKNIQNLLLINKAINSSLENSSLNKEILSELTGISYDKMSKMINLGYNMSIFQFVEYKRMVKSIILLEKNYKVSEIYKLVGYTNIRSFRRAFKKVFLFCPSDFKETFLENKT